MSIRRHAQRLVAALDATSIAAIAEAPIDGARSLGPAVFVGGTALAQVWLYLVVPTIAGAIAGWLVKSRTLDV